MRPLVEIHQEIAMIDREINKWQEEDDRLLSAIKGLEERKKALLWALGEEKTE